MPNSFAAIWSTDTPQRISAPEVIFGCVPVRYALHARGWSPAISNSSLCASLFARPLITNRRSLNAAKGSRIGDSSKPLPEAAGVHFSMMIPLGTVKNERRVARPDPVCAAEAKAGNMASSTGNASAVPAPRKNVRRGMHFLNMVTILQPFSFGTAHW